MKKGTKKKHHLKEEMFYMNGYLSQSEMRKCAEMMFFECLSSTKHMEWYLPARNQI